jgi:hypothetical protein
LAQLLGQIDIFLTHSGALIIAVSVLGEVADLLTVPYTVPPHTIHGPLVHICVFWTLVSVHAAFMLLLGFSAVYRICPCRPRRSGGLSVRHSESVFCGCFLCGRAAAEQPVLAVLGSGSQPVPGLHRRHRDLGRHLRHL